MKPRIMLVEDNLGDIAFIRRALDQHVKDYDLEVIRTGSDALRTFTTLESNPRPLPDLVVLDLNLPRVSGQTLLRFLRKSESLSTIPVIVATSSDALDDHLTALFEGAIFFRKPTNVHTFMQIGQLIVEMLAQHSH